jgi:putative FmdB family regulatory protein
MDAGQYPADGVVVGILVAHGVSRTRPFSWHYTAHGGQAAAEQAMPIYDYQCRSCGHGFDALQKLSDAPLTDCPACGAAELQKRLSAPAFQLQGKGWRKPKAELKKTVRRGHMFDQATPHAEHTDSHGGGHNHGHAHDHGHSHPHGHGSGHDHDH